MFLFGARRFGRMGPLGLAYMGYRLWRNLSPAQKQRLRTQSSDLLGRMRANRPPPPPPP